jgi:regulator of replication initiation timing
MLLLCCLFAPFALSAQTVTDNSAELKALQHKLLRMGKEDQKYRMELQSLVEKMSGPEAQKVTPRFKAILKKQDAIDHKNILQLEAIIKQYGWLNRSLVGQEASGAAFLIIQHAALSYQKRYFQLIQEAAAKNEAQPSDAAMLEDRILTHEGKKQIYGTQLRINNETSKLELFPIEDEENVDARRASVGMPPLAVYLKMFGLEYQPQKKRE